MPEARLLRPRCFCGRSHRKVLANTQPGPGCSSARGFPPSGNEIDEETESPRFALMPANVEYPKCEYERFFGY
jgi:hypothetical protein